MGGGKFPKIRGDVSWDLKRKNFGNGEEKMFFLTVQNTLGNFFIFHMWGHVNSHLMWSRVHDTTWNKLYVMNQNFKKTQSFHAQFNHYDWLRKVNMRRVISYHHVITFYFPITNFCLVHLMNHKQSLFSVLKSSAYKSVHPLRYFNDSACNSLRYVTFWHFDFSIHFHAIVEDFNRKNRRLVRRGGV